MGGGMGGPSYVPSGSSGKSQLTPREIEAQELATDTRKEPGIIALIVVAFICGGIMSPMSQVAGIIVGILVFAFGLWFRHWINKPSKVRA